MGARVQGGNDDGLQFWRRHNRERRELCSTYRGDDAGEKLRAERMGILRYARERFRVGFRRVHKFSAAA